MNNNNLAVYRFTFFLVAVSLIFTWNLPVVHCAGAIKIFALERPNQSQNADELSELRNPLVYGLSWRFKWSAIEPRDGQYDWTDIDNAINITNAAGKKIMLRVTAGINSPPWVYHAGAKAFTFESSSLAHEENYAKNLMMPIPWDEVYLSKWTRFISAFGSRYSSNSSIYSIQMTGGGHIGEMNLPKTPSHWEKVDFSNEKLINAWQRIIDSYQTAFPNIPTSIDINEPLADSDVLQPVVDYATSRYPNKVYIQHNGLKASFRKDGRIRKIIRAASKITRTGYQMVGGKGFLERETGDRLIAFKNAMYDNVSYIEIYSSDIRDETRQKDLQYLATNGAQ